MGRQLVIAAAVATLAVGGPALLPNAGTVDAQIGGCECVAAFDAIDSDLRNVGRRYNRTTLGVSAGGCASACSTWRRDWFSRDACDNPTRINRGARASWGFDSGQSETFVGPDTWYCPFPPP